MVLGAVIAILECAGAALPARADEPCLDPDAELGAAGRRKGVQKRDFLKRLRLELSAWGGFFASDLLSTSYDYGGAIAFYPGEDFGFEASLLVTPFDLAVERPLTQFFAGQVFKPSLAFVVVGNFLWSPIHLKLRVSDHAIAHGDLFFALGAGDTFNQTVQGLTFDVGIGLKLYANRFFAVRFDLRDYLMIQEAVAVQRVTNNIVGLFGLSLFIPGPRS
ncbi:MAG TPA: outer membrane beta-barrel domain-containing protein [Polyangia bacterium]